LGTHLFLESEKNTFVILETYNTLHLDSCFPWW